MAGSLGSLVELGPALRTDLAEAMHEERKNGHVPKQSDGKFIRVQRYHHICCYSLTYRCSCRRISVIRSRRRISYRRSITRR